MKHTKPIEFMAIGAVGLFAAAVGWGAVVLGPGYGRSGSEAGVITARTSLHVGASVLDDAERATYLGALNGHTAAVYKSPTCTCCDAYVDLLREAGMRVDVVVTDEVGAVKVEHGVPLTASSCHTMAVDGYVVEGHVPLVAVGELIATRPDVDGIAVPGMPPGSPGMPGEPAPLPVLAFIGGAAHPFWDAR
jgi:hypothetical protein